MFTGVVLAGGGGTRLGGITKATLQVGDRQLLDVALDALSGATGRIAVGPQLLTSRPVTWVREDPVGGGPVSAIAAALPLVVEPIIVVLAADLPFVTPAAIEALVEGCTEVDAVLAIDSSGRDQPLLAAYRSTSLRTAMPEQPQGASLRSVIGRLESRGAVRRIDLGGDPPVTVDVDTATDLDRARERA